MTPPADYDTATQYYAPRFEELVAETARRLRALADKVEQEGQAPPNRVGEPDYGWKASQIVHAVVWGVANLGLDRLVSIAAGADRRPR